MKRILVLSGKGGTGKTTLTATLVQMLHLEAFADCDVDAPNLHLICAKKDWKRTDTPFLGMAISWIDNDKCTGCGKCVEVCRFDALVKTDTGTYKVNPFNCEGCAVCQYVCPEKAISSKDNITGKTSIYTQDKTIFSTAQLNMGSGNSGKLVTQVKKNLDDAVPENEGIAIIDGSPGIGCPVIASLSGIDLALMVTEPTSSGLHDLKRIVKTSKIFASNVAIVINKSDIDEVGCHLVEAYCAEEQLPIIGYIPYDSTVSQTINRGENLASIDCPSSKAIGEIAKKIPVFLEK